MIRVDCLGLADKKFKLSVVTKVVPKDFVICVLDDSFGDALKKIKKLKKKGYRRFLIHCHWSTAHKIVPTKKLKDKCKKWEQFACQTGSLVWISHSLEYNEQSKKAVQKRVDIIRKFAPSCAPVNCCYKGATLDDVLTERHGDIAVKPGEIVSTDGEDWKEVDLKSYVKRNSKAYMVALWRHEFNFRKTKDDTTPIHLRQVKPTVKMMEDLLTKAGVI